MLDFDMREQQRIGESIIMDYGLFWPDAIF